ncbi:MAG: DEAD/DEAH box helicase, partial [Myxococcales bacterium]|nr:DEAD/DEAH box helicase [Myxococcales bacterium]
LLLGLDNLRQLLDQPPAVDQALRHLTTLRLADTLGALCTPAAAAVFRRRITPEQGATFAEQVWAHRTELAPGPPTDLRPGLSAVELSAWAHAHEVGHWLHAPVLAAMPVLELPTWMLQNKTLGQVASGSASAVRSGHNMQQQLRALALGQLQERADAAVLGKAEHPGRQTGRVPPTDPTLSQIYDALQTERARLAGQLPPRPAAEMKPGKLQVTADPPGLVLRLPKRVPNACGHGAKVQLLRDKSGVFALTCSCTESGQPNVCEAQIEAVERFLDLLGRPPKAADKRRLRALADGFGAPSWKRSVDKFLSLAKLQTTAEAKSELAPRVWRLERDGARVVRLTYCMRQENGDLRRLDASADGLSDQQRRMVALVQPAMKLTYRDAAAAADLWRQIAEQLVGADDVVVTSAGGRGPRSAVQIERRTVGIQLERIGAACQVQATLDGVGVSDLERKALWAVIDDDAGLHFDATRRCLDVVTASPRVIQMLAALDLGPSRFPLAALPTLRTSLSQTQRRDIHISKAANGAPVQSVTTPHLRLGMRPAKDGAMGLWLQVRVTPVASGEACIPGVGAATAFAMQGGEPVHGHRDLAAERQVADELWLALGLPPIDEVDFEAPSESHTNPYSWLASDPDQALALLHRTQQLAAPSGSDQQDASSDASDTSNASDTGAHPWSGEPIVVQWEGQPTRVVGRAQARQLRVELIEKRDWFSLQGTLQVGDRQVPLSTLLEALRKGRQYVQVSDGDWVALADSVREGLTPIAIAADKERLSPLAGPALADLGDLGADVSGPAQWLQLSGGIRAAAALNPDVPSTLNAQLRPYQIKGFTWLMQLAVWAPGAVLADDMGLGKTLMALALLLARAAEGPALVVMPTSVLDNWRRETRRFAPTLDVRPIRGADDMADWTAPAAGELVLTTWELLHRHQDKFDAPTWATVVFDEAQYLKNPGTKRAKAAFSLDASFRLALTGTPMENRTSELWSVLRAAVPGLLSSQRDFRARFAVPIERYGDERVKQALATLIRPFVLRRLKADVAPELPGRQDIRVDVTLPPGARAAYDGLRESLAAELKKKKRDRVGRIEVLAALTRLRQLACHPQLTDPDSKTPAAKVIALRAHLAELRAEGHQALVFSQFTSLLDLVRPALIADGLRVLQLDGRTPGNKRQPMVDSFQRGDADVFLLSVKAGGTGLNLTAASYVFHLDPWWNPAVEDQATDRAHRIGQQRGVSVYRIVAKGTVEEAIYELHKDKRDLVSRLLSGTDKAKALSITELESLVLYSGKRTWHREKPAHEHESGSPLLSG